MVFLSASLSNALDLEVSHGPRPQRPSCNVSKPFEGCGRITIQMFSFKKEENRVLMPNLSEEETIYLPASVSRFREANDKQN